MISIFMPNGYSINCESTTPITDKNDFVPDWPELEKLDDCYCSSDFHLLKEFITRDEDGNKQLVAFDEDKIDKTRLEKIEKMCEKIDDDKALIFLGDLTESEFEEGSAYIEWLKPFCQKLFRKDTHIAPRILVRGNNDVLSKETYKELGFDFVVPKIQLGNILFSHKPLNVDGETVNIHGHLHENKIYFDISPRNHINVYYKLVNGIQNVTTLIDYFNAGLYKDSVICNSDEFRTSDMIEDVGENYE